MTVCSMSGTRQWNIAVAAVTPRNQRRPARAALSAILAALATMWPNFLSKLSIVSSQHEPSICSLHIARAGTAMLSGAVALLLIAVAVASWIRGRDGCPKWAIADPCVPSPTKPYHQSIAYQIRHY
jgi:hypothetical protein